MISDGLLRSMNVLRMVAGLLCASPAAQGEETWEMIGPYSATVFSHARNPENPDRLMVGTHYGGVYRSFDGGLTWEHLDTAFASAAVFALCADPGNPGTFYVGTFERGVFRTTDGGGSWVALNEGLTNQSVTSLAVNPFDSQEILATTFHGVFRSTNGGASWTPPPVDGDIPALSVIFSEGRDGLCHVGLDGGGVFRSENSGQTWAPWNEGLEGATIHRLSASPDDPDEIYAATNRGVFRRIEGDQGWTDLNFNLPVDVGANQVTFHPDGRVFAATNVGVFTLADRDATQWFNWSLRPTRFVLIEPYATRIHLAQTELTFVVTLDDGANFADASTGIQNNFPDALASIPDGTGSLVISGSDMGVSVSSGPGTTAPVPWSLAPDLTEHLVLELRPDPGQPEVVFAGTERAGVWRSDDRGLTWLPKSAGILPTTITSISQSPQPPHRMYCGTSTGLYVSDDDGVSWRVGPEVAVPSFVTAVETDPVAEDIAYFGTNFGEFLFTIDGGTTYGSSLDLPDERITRIAAAAYRQVFALTGSGRVFASSDRGRIWNAKDEDIRHPGSDLDFNQSESWKGYLATLGGGVYRTTSEGTEWSQVNEGIDNLYVFSIDVDPHDPETVYAGSVGCVFRSHDEGESWAKTGAGLPVGEFVVDLEVDPFDENRIAASVLGRGVYLSADRGETWSAAGTGDPFHGDEPLPLAFSQSASDELFAGSRRGGLRKTLDGGESWVGSSDGITDLVRAIQVSHQDSSRVYAGTLNSGMFRSLDGGESWDFSGLENRRIIHSAIDRFNGDRVLVGTGVGLAATFDGGGSWHDLGQRLAYVLSMTADPALPGSFFVGGPGGTVHHSADDGRTTSFRGEGLPERNIRALHRTPGGGLYAGTGIPGAVFRSEDDGVSWKEISTGRFAAERVTEIVLETDFNQLYVVGDKSGLHLADPNGEAWIEVPTPGVNGEDNPISAFRISPHLSNDFALSRFDETGTLRSLHLSNDRGATWWTPDATSSLPGGSLWSVEFSPHRPGLLFIAHDTGVYRSRDGGESWQLVLSGENDILAALHPDRDHPGRVFAGGINGTVMVSEDEGETWQDRTPEEGGLNVLKFVSGAGGMVHMATYNRGVVSSSDAGRTWTASIDPDLATFVGNFVGIDPADPRTVYVATSQQGVLKSVDGGVHWKRMNQGLGSHLTALCLLVDPLDPDTIYVGTTTGGVFVSENGGESWVSLAGGMFHELIIALTVDAADHRTVYAGVEGGGVYRMRREAKALAGDKDHDKDGIRTLVEEYMGLDPLTPNPPGMHFGTLGPGRDRFELRWQRAPVAPDGISAELQWSPNLRDWYGGGDGPGGSGPELPIEDLGIQADGFGHLRAWSPLEGGSRFLRLRLRRD